MSRPSSLLAALAALAVCAAAMAARPQQETGSLRVLVAYCPSLEGNSSRAAVVDVQLPGGAFKVVGSFELPGDAVYGCPENYSPTPVEGANGTAWLQFLNSFAYTLPVGLESGALAGGGVAPADPFFKGFVNAWQDGERLVGFTPTVTQNGLCHDGCIGFGAMSTADGTFEQAAALPFKGVLDYSHAVRDGVAYVQGSYDLRPAAERCDPADARTECLYAVDTATGALQASHPTPSWTAYRYGRAAAAAATAAAAEADATVVAWVEGFANVCRNEEDNNFAFARVNLATAEATPVACIERNVTVHTAPWTSSFSLDNTMLATASGNTETGSLQLLVFDAASGSAVLQSALEGLPAQLGAAAGLVDVWAVDWV